MKFINRDFKLSRKGGQYLTEPTDACKLVVMSDRAYRSVIAEACAHMDTETGGILLGRAVDGVWFVTEVIDPGLDVTQRPELFMYDARYVNHLIPKISVIYDYGLEILGIWHRHPGSMDFFSRTDDQSHDKIIHHELHRPMISMLVNFDPVFRRTMYYVDDDVNYRKVELVTGDDQMIPEFLKLAPVNDIFRRFGVLNRSPEYVAETPATTTVEAAATAPEVENEKPVEVTESVAEVDTVSETTPAVEKGESAEVTETEAPADAPADAPVDAGTPTAQVPAEADVEVPATVAETPVAEVKE